MSDFRRAMGRRGARERASSDEDGGGASVAEHRPSATRSSFSDGQWMDELIGGAKASPDERVLAIDPGRVERDPRREQPRQAFDEGEIAKLRSSMEGEEGQIEPAVVWRDEDRFYLIVGERRWRAARQPAPIKLKVVVRPRPDDEQMLRVQLAENLRRVDLTVLEEADSFARLVDFAKARGVSARDEAIRWGMKPAALSKLVMIARAPPFVRDVASTRANHDVSALYELARFAKEDARGAERFARRWQEGGAEQGSMRRALERVRVSSSGDGTAPKKPRERLVTVLDAAMVEGERVPTLELALESEGGKPRAVRYRLGEGVAAKLRSAIEGL